MAGDATPDPAPQVPDTPETADLLLATFAELYRHEVGAEEDVFRTLPFFSTALGIVVTALAYAAGRLPRWPDIATSEGRKLRANASVLLVVSLSLVLAATIVTVVVDKLGYFPKVTP